MVNSHWTLQIFLVRLFAKLVYMWFIMVLLWICPWFICYVNQRGATCGVHHIPNHWGPLNRRFKVYVVFRFGFEMFWGSFDIKLSNNIHSWSMNSDAKRPHPLTSRHKWWLVHENRQNVFLYSLGNYCKWYDLPREINDDPFSMWLEPIWDTVTTYCMTGMIQEGISS